MGEHETQFQIAVRLVPLVLAWLALKGVKAKVAGNQFWYFARGQPKRCRAPDLYVVWGVAPGAPDRATWKTWADGRTDLLGEPWPCSTIRILDGDSDE